MKTITINKDDMFDPIKFVNKLVDEVRKKAAKHGIDPLDNRFEIHFNTKYNENNYSYSVEAGLRLRPSEYIKMKDIENEMLKKFEFKYGM